MSRSREWVAVTLVSTALLGVALRLDLASGAVTALGLDFADVRHAHSHLGFYGFLTLAWWLVLREREALSWPRWLVPGHLAVVFVATALFARAGYDATTIALSTVVALSWLYVAVRSRRVKGWLSLAPWGVLAGTLLIPAIAVMGVGFYMLHNTLQTRATQMAPDVRGSAVAIFATFYFLSQAVGVWLAGQVLDRWGAAPVFLTAAALLLLLGVLLLRFMPAELRVAAVVRAPAAQAGREA